ncbi:putative salt tolerance-like protein [Apostasia shenzhenica]|uniref:Putative salt tolerance-like protein n=1 Tax=Apostasia shenzhenica TaxID=1088818 RepID=A0A2I0BG25_9ASPA|nr:putative salt tolerance-like protein [Apostasia shenzhenica]
MKVQCDVCERAEAVVLCCADEAALCWGCDEKVHAANKLAGKHQRVPFLLPTAAPAASKMPICDICQDKVGYFFCLEDRAVLCRSCDVAIHAATPAVSNHQRFLITGVRVSLQHYLGSNCRRGGRATTAAINSSNSSGSVGNSNNPPSSMEANSFDRNKELLSEAGIVVEDVGFGLQWPWSEVLENAELDCCHGLSEPGSST